MDTEKPKRLIFDSRLIAEKDYWLKRLSTARLDSAIKTDFEPPVINAGARRVVKVALPEVLIQKLIKTTKDSPFLLYTILMAALKVCLYKYTGGSLVVGSPARRHETAGRQSDNALAIFEEVDGQLSFREFLFRVRENLSAAYANQSYPFGRLVEDLGLAQVSNRCPLFDVALVLKNLHHDLPELKNHITISFLRTPQELTAEVEYESTVFREVTVTRLMEHFVSLLGEALENVDRTLDSLEMLSDVERRQIMRDWNDTEVTFLQQCVHRLFELKAGESPAMTAVVCKEAHLSYAELNRRANQLANYLQTLGVGPEAITGIRMNPSVELIVAILAVLKAGGAYLPLDPALPQSRVAFMLNDAGARVVLTEQSLEASLPDCEALMVCVDSQSEAISSCGAENPGAGVTLNNLAYVIYTSGSTGQPKGVLVEHRGLCNLAHAQAAAFRIQPGTRLLQFASIGFDASVSEIFTTLISGATLCLEDKETRYSRASLAHTLRELDITTVTLPPALLSVTSAEDLDGLSTLVTAGESCSAAVVERWAPGRQFINAYGPTETSVCASMWECEQTPDGPPPIGRPIANTRIYLLNQQQQLAPAGIEGEIFVAGVSLARGYAGRPQLTAEKFLPDPFSETAGGRLYRTGDNARYLPNGDIEFLGRYDHQIKIRGYRIELGEIEAVLNEVNAVQTAIVLASKDRGQEARLIAYVVPKSETPLTADDLRDFLQEQLPEYMIPSHFVLLSELPLNRNGKIDRSRLPKPEEAKPALQSSYESPRTESEQMLMEIWKEVLGIERLGIHDDFFRLGGHSLLVAQVVSRVAEVMNVELPVRALFEAPTIAELNVVVMKNQANEVEDEDLAEILNELDQLSEAEAEMLIHEESNLAVSFAEPIA